MRQILELELQAVQERVMASAGTKFMFQCSDSAKDLLLREGLDVRYGARHLKRSIGRFLVSPLSNLVASEQVGFGDLIYVDLDPESEKFTFSKRPEGGILAQHNGLAEKIDMEEQPLGGIGIPFPERRAANMVGI